MQRRSVHVIIMLLPAVVLLAICALAIRDLHKLRSLDSRRVSRELQDNLAGAIPESFPLPEDLAARDPGKKVVFLFGSSSLMLSDGGTFPEYLQQAHDDLQVVNLGIIGIASSSLRQRVEDALAVARPDIIVVYYGDNDYNNAYQGFILPNYVDTFDWLLRLPYLFHDKEKPLSPFAPDGGFGWFARINRPKLYNLLQQCGLLTIDHAAYASFNQLILDNFIRNNAAILDLAETSGIPVVLITPIGNLHAEPYGDIRETTADFRKGMATTDYRQSLALLKSARDTELFTYDLRAKSPLIDYLRSVSRRQVYVLDLEKSLEARHFGFGYGDFLDYVHFSDRTHRLLADVISDFLVEIKLVIRPSLHSATLAACGSGS